MWGRRIGLGRQCQWRLSTVISGSLLPFSQNSNTFYVFHIWKLWMIFPLKGTEKPCTQRKGKTSLWGRRAGADVRGQRCSEFPLFLQEGIATLLTWKAELGCTDSRDRRGSLVWSIKGKRLLWEPDNIWHDHLCVSLYFPLACLLTLPRGKFP